MEMVVLIVNKVHLSNHGKFSRIWISEKLGIETILELGN